MQLNINMLKFCYFAFNTNFDFNNFQVLIMINDQITSIKLGLIINLISTYYSPCYQI